MSDYCVIGSGPAAVSAAMALTRRNLRVVMLDAGISLDAERRHLVSQLSERLPHEWQAAEVARLKEGIEATAAGIPLKRLYGSDFPFQSGGIRWTLQSTTTGIRPSFAKGGLSTVWGAGVLPFHPADMADWPFDPSELDPHYREVFSFLPCAAARDDLEEVFPIHSVAPHDLQPSRQAAAFLQDAAQARDRLRRDGIVIGRSRLAVQPRGTAPAGGQPCQYCGLCLYGCPYELIYSAEHTLRMLRSRPNFRYVPDFVVDRLREDHNEVTVTGYDRRTGEPREVRAGRVFLGAGVIPSTLIILCSLGEFGVRLRIQDSFYFLLPLVRVRGTPQLQEEKLHTLAQAFIAIRDEEICRYLVHLSVYTFNDLLAPSLRAAAGPLSRFGSAFAEAMASRMLVCGGYLHSHLSPGMWITVKNSGDTTTVHLEAEDSRRAKSVARRVGMKLVKTAASLRGIPLVPMIRFSHPGRGFHSGGSFPISRERSSHTADLEGRPYGFDRVHLVDASCLPSIPASTITLPVMANAHRIATLAAQRGL